jgi:RHS repeat-associated protein
VAWADAPADPWGSDGIRRPHLGFRDELAVDDLVWMGERVYDARTREFLSPDPLLGVPGRPGHASAYAFGFFDPVNHLDPTGRRPISQEEFDAIREREEKGRFGQAWEAIKDDPWGTLAMVGVVAVGVTLMFVPGGQVIGGPILLGAAGAAGLGVATGTFSPTDVAVGGVFGLIPGGSTYRSAIAIGAASHVVQTVGLQTIRGDGYDWEMVALSAATGGVTGAAGHRLWGPRSPADLPSAPTAPMPAPAPVTASARPAFAIDSAGTTHLVPAPGGVIEIERIAPRPMKPGDATNAWDDFLGDGPHSNVHPRTGELDPDRIVSADGTRSIRYGDHEMGGRPSRHHFHQESWSYDPNLDVWWVDNTMIRVPLG